MNAIDKKPESYPEQSIDLDIDRGIVQPLVYWPDKRLKQKCSNVLFSEYTKLLARNLYTTMKNHGGIGIAAPQIGIMLNVILIKESMASDPIVLINPEILEISDYCITEREGCLSVPGYYENRSRAGEIKVKYNTLENKEIIENFQGLGAFVIQHEIEHLDGKVFVDNLSDFKKSRILNKMKKAIKFK